MKVGIGIGSAYYNGEDWQELVQYTMAADSMGVDYVWSAEAWGMDCLLYTSPSPRDLSTSRMPSSA